MKQTILGSGGAIGVPLAKELKKYTNDIQLVSRNPKQVNKSDKLFPADLNKKEMVEKAIEGSNIVYVTVGFKYSAKVWKQTWPAFIRNVIDACKRNNSKLVFFDNMYMYDKSAIPFMTEESPINPPSRKGAVRARLHEMIMDEVDKGKLTALIARAADFYGSDKNNSILTIMVADRLKKGKKAQIFGNADKIHTFTYTRDAAEAMAILGNTTDAWNEVWHVPTTKEKLTTYEWMKLISQELNTDLKIQKVPAWLMKALGLFVPIMREFPEMLYQYEQDYVFDSSKFENKFGIKATPAREGIKKLISSVKS